MVYTIFYHFLHLMLNQHSLHFLHLLYHIFSLSYVFFEFSHLLFNFFSLRLLFGFFKKLCDRFLHFDLMQIQYSRWLLNSNMRIFLHDGFDPLNMLLFIYVKMISTPIYKTSTFAMYKLDTIFITAKPVIS